MKLTRMKGLRRGWWVFVSALIVLFAGAQGVTTTTVQGTVYMANGQPGSGTLQVNWPSFTTASNQAIAAGRTTVSIGADGFVSVNLAPNQGATPAGLYYTAVYHLSDGTTSTEYWVVPSAAQASLGQVRAQVMPAAQAVQTVSKTYVDQSIQELTQSLLTASGGNLSGPLYLNGDPLQPTQAATKHYVDQALGQDLSTNGGTLSGPLYLSGDPSQATQAATKQYVDKSFGQAVPMTGGVVSGALTGLQLGAAYQVDQFAGAGFGAKLQACLNGLSATYGGTCDARNFTGNLSMSAALTVGTANATVQLPCATITTAFPIVVTAGTRNVTFHGCALRGASAGSGSQGGTVLLYTGAAAAVQVGDPTYAADTLGFHMDNLVINTTASQSASAQALAMFRTQEISLANLYLLGSSNQTGMTLDGTGNYTGGTFEDLELNGFQTAVNARGHQVANSATTDWVNASTFVRLHVDCPLSSGSPVSGTYGINLAQGDGNTFTGGDIEGCGTALHLGPNAQNNTIVGLRNENSINQVVADAGSAYNNWITGGTMFTGQLVDNGTRNSFLDTFHRSFNGLNGDWYGSQQDATVTNHYRIGIGMGNERGYLNRYQTDSGYRWTTGLSDATAGEQFYQVLDELNSVYRLSIGQYNNGQASTNNQTVINAAGTGAIVLNGSTNAGTGGVVFGSGGTNGATVATINNAGNAQFNGTLQVGGPSTFTSSTTVKNGTDAEIDAFLWAGATANQKESYIYKDYTGASQWYMVKDASNNWALNSATGGLDSFKAYQSTNSGDTYVNASNSSGHIRLNYETGAGAETDIYAGGSAGLVAAFSGPTAVKLPGLASGSGKNCLQIDNSGYLSNSGASCGGGVGSGSAGQVAVYAANGTTIAGTSAVSVAAGGTGATSASAALSNLGGLNRGGDTMTGPLALSTNLSLAGGTAMTGNQGNGSLLQHSSGTANSTSVTKFDGNGNTTNSSITDNGSIVQSSENINGPTFIASGAPTLDIRHPTFGGVCDGSTDIGPALQAAWNALPSSGGEIILVGSPSACRWVNPTTFNWGGKFGPVTIYLQGSLSLGTTLEIPNSVAVNIIGRSGTNPAQFQAPGQTASISVDTYIGSFGTTITPTYTGTGTPTSSSPVACGATTAGSTYQDTTGVSSLFWTCALTTGSITGGTNSLTISGSGVTPAGGFSVGDRINVAGAGISGVVITAISGSTFTLASNATTTVSGATVSMYTSAAGWLGSTNGWIAGAVETITPGTMAGLYPGTAISIIERLSCSTATLSRSGNVATATFASACHIPPGVGVCVAGASDATFNGCRPSTANAGQAFTVRTSDYGTNTLTWLNTGSNTSGVTGATVTGLYEDNVEDTLISATTATTFTATFFRPHASTDAWGVVAIDDNTNAKGGLRRDFTISDSGGTPLYIQQAYKSIYENVGATTTGGCNTPSSAVSNPTVEIGLATWIYFRGVAFNSDCEPWSIHVQSPAFTGYADSGPIYIDDSFLTRGIKLDHGGFGVYWNKTICEQCSRAVVSYDTAYYWNANPQVININNAFSQDNPDNFTSWWVYQLAPGGPLSGAMGSTTFGPTGGWIPPSLLTNSYAQTRVVGSIQDAELTGEQANLGPSVIPYATSAAVATNPASWTGYCTLNSSTATAPDGTSTAGALVFGTGAYSYAGTVSGYTPAVGDTMIFGGFAYAPTSNTGNSFFVDNNSSAHYTFLNGGTGSYQKVNATQWDSYSSWWHPIVGMATVATSDGTTNQQIHLGMNCATAGQIYEYWQPFLIVVPASAGVPAAELQRWRQQLLHGAVPPNYNGPGIPATSEPIAAKGYYNLAPSGGAPNQVIPPYITGYQGNSSGVDIPFSVPWSSPTTLISICHDANGNVTDSGCPSGGNVAGPGSSTIGDAVEFNNTGGTLLKDAGAAPMLTNVPGWLQWLGDGSEAAPACSSGCTAAQEHWYASLTVPSGQTLTVNNAAPFIVRSTGTCTIAGTISAGPNTGGTGSGTPNTSSWGGAAGGGGYGAANGSTGNSAYPSGGGAGGTSGVAGGTGGNIPAPYQRYFLSGDFGLSYIGAFSSGFSYIGGAKGGAGGSSGGAGGNGGGTVVLDCATINFTGSIDVSGGNGVAGGSNTGGGGGGGGGIVILRSPNMTNSGTINVAGGNGGAAGSGTSTAGGTGGVGWSVVFSK